MQRKNRLWTVTFAPDPYPLLQPASPFLVASGAEPLAEEPEKVCDHRTDNLPFAFQETSAVLTEFPG